MNFSSKKFYSADSAIRGKGYSNEGWEHPPTSNAVGWVKHAGNSPIAYLQFGDGPDNIANHFFRKIIGMQSHGQQAVKLSRDWAQHCFQESGKFS